MGTQPVQGVYHLGDLPTEQAQRLHLDEGAGRLPVLGVKEECGLPQVLKDVEQIEDLGDLAERLRQVGPARCPQGVLKRVRPALLHT